ncbi:MAG: GNAT family N-acetyltransferase [Anaerolineaceae bacterium]|nr:GNAT family N-acetyltransferase [Anaerolineaceae bacterium]
MRIIIRKPKLDDIDALAVLHFETWKIGYRELISDEVLSTLSVEGFVTRWKERIINPKAAEYVVLAEREGQIMGFAIFGESREAINLPKEFSEIYAIYVYPKYWQQGVGKVLMQHAFTTFSENKAPGCFLWTLKENMRARIFYERMGMKLTKQERYITIHDTELLCCSFIKSFIL